jgi:methylenetetrahydrofolate dehydrogenase (NADP+)/methenyltetrahydrofolate cyclohydrolase
MTAKIIDGKAIAAELREDVAKGVKELIAAGGTKSRN